MKVALAQIDIQLADVDKNEQRIMQAVAQAADQEADVVVLPEMWNSGYALQRLKEVADVGGTRTKQLLQSLSKEYDINIVGGSVATLKGQEFYNTMYVVSNDAQCLSEYDKVHLIGLMHEDRYMTAGSHLNTFELADVPSAGVICYDIRFPEWVRTNMAQIPAKVLYVVAQWPIQRIEQWQVMLQSRAIENQAYVVAVNRVGADDDNTFGGRSLVIDPLGHIMIKGSAEKEEIYVTDIDFAQIDNIRGQMPIFLDRKPHLYR